MPKIFPFGLWLALYLICCNDSSPKSELIAMPSDVKAHLRSPMFHAHLQSPLRLYSRYVRVRRMQVSGWWPINRLATCWTDRIARLYIINMASNYKVGVKQMGTIGRNITQWFLPPNIRSNTKVLGRVPVGRHWERRAASSTLFPQILGPSALSKRYNLGTSASF